jgi:hypothetical protein
MIKIIYKRKKNYVDFIGIISFSGRKAKNNFLASGEKKNLTSKNRDGF